MAAQGYQRTYQSNLNKNLSNIKAIAGPSRTTTVRVVRLEMVQSNGLHLQALTGEQQEEDWARLGYSIVGNHNEDGEFFMG